MLLNRVDTSTAPDIEWPVNPVRGNHWDYAAARRAQNVLRLDAIFPEAENITTVPLTLVLTFSKCSESICVKPSSESFVFEKMPF